MIGGTVTNHNEQKCVSSVMPTLPKVGDVICSCCGHDNVWRVRRSTMERIKSAITGAYPFLCKQCYSKFFKPLPQRRTA